MACCIRNQHIWDTAVGKVLACKKVIDRYAVAVKKDRTIILIIGHLLRKVLRACLLYLRRLSLGCRYLQRVISRKHKLASFENVRTIIAIHCKMYFVYNIFMV